MSVIERTTNIPMRSVGFEYNKAVASSDLNELQSISSDNIIEYLDGDIPNNTLRVVIDDLVDNKPGITVKGFKYLVSDINGVKYYGHISAPDGIVLSYPGTPASGSEYNIYAYYRTLDADGSDTVYVNGIRTNSSQASISEVVTTNNIADPILGDISIRKSLEFTFVVSTSAVSLTGWSNAVKIASVVLNEDLESDITNEFVLGGNNVLVDGVTILKDSNNVISVNEFTGTKAEAIAAFDDIPEGGTIYTTDEVGGEGVQLGDASNRISTNDDALMELAEMVSEQEDALIELASRMED